MPPKIQKDCFIANTAVIIGEVTIEAGASVWYGAVLRGDENSIHIGEGTNVQDNVTVHNIPSHPVRIGKNCSIGHGAIVHGCTIHDNVIIGINSTILDGAEIHTGSIIGANALVLENQVIPENSLAVGVPAKVIRKDDAALPGVCAENARKYHELRDLHRKGNYRQFHSK